MRHVVLPQAIRRVDPAADERLHRPAEGLGAGRVPRRHRGSPQAQIISANDFNFTPYVALALVYVVITVPQVLFVDWLIERDQRRRQAGGVDVTDVTLRVEGLHKSFGDLEVLRGVDLVVDDHEVVCLIGASGSGKSTLLRCIDLLEPIDAGRILIEGPDVTARGRRSERRPQQDRASCSSRSTCSRI